MNNNSRFLSSIDEGYYLLGQAVLFQAVKDYFWNDPSVTERTIKKRKEKIISDLKTPYMLAITNGSSEIVLDRILYHPDEVKALIDKYVEEDEEI